MTTVLELQKKNQLRKTQDIQQKYQLRNAEKIRYLDYRMRTLFLNVVNRTITARLKNSDIDLACPMHYTKLICVSCFTEISPLGFLYNKKKAAKVKCLMHIECAERKNYI